MKKAEDMTSEHQALIKLRVNFIFLLALLIPFLLACDLPAHQDSESHPVDHSHWNTLLKKHVDRLGNVNYIGFVNDSIALNGYLKSLSENHPNNKNWTRNETLVYWINAYNAFTVQLVVRNYPINSIKDIAGIIPFVNTTWDLEFINIEGHVYDLNNIEHGILRSNFEEPRIHFALVCAAKSCPKLRDEAYDAEQINIQLDEQAYEFFNSPSKNQISERRISLSKLLKWYKGDFTSTNNTMIDYINQYVNITIKSDAAVSYLDYDWDLNEQ